MSGAETKTIRTIFFLKIHIIMKIMCQEHYDKVVHYADQIGDKSLQQCLDKLKKRGSCTPRRPCVIELYRDCAPYSFLFKQRYDDGSLGIVGRTRIPRIAGPLRMLQAHEPERSLANAYVGLSRQQIFPEYFQDPETLNTG